MSKFIPIESGEHLKEGLTVKYRNGESGVLETKSGVLLHDPRTGFLYDRNIYGHMIYPLFDTHDYDIVAIKDES